MNLTDFLISIPKNKVATYKDVAQALGTSSRHAGYLLSKNDYTKSPCYKIIRSDGSLGGYSGPGGLKRKAELLKKDGIEIVKGRIDLSKHGL